MIFMNLKSVPTRTDLDTEAIMIENPSRGKRSPLGYRLIRSLLSVFQSKQGAIHV